MSESDNVRIYLMSESDNVRIEVMSEADNVRAQKNEISKKKKRNIKIKK